MTPQEQYNQVATYGGALKDPNDIRKIAQRAFELNLKRLGQTGNFEQNAATYQAKVGDILSGGNAEGMAPEVRALAQQAVDEYKMNIIPRTPETGPGSQYLRGGQEPITPPQQAQQWNITPGQAPTPTTPTGMPSLEQPQGPQTAQQWNITPGQSPTPIKPPTGVNEPGSIGDSGQNKPQQQAQGGKLLRPSEFTNLQKQGLTENDIIRLGGDIYLKPNSRFTIGGTGEGIAPVQTTSAPSTQGTPPAQSQAQQQQSGFQISPDYKASDYSSITGQAPITPPQSSVDAAQKAYEEALGYKPLSVEETEAQKRRDELDAQARAIAASRDLGLVSTEGQAVAMPFITGQQAQIQKQAAAQISAISAQEIPLEQKLARLQASREAQRQASLDISKSRLEAEKFKETSQFEKNKFAQEQAFKEKELPMKYQPETAKAPTLQGSAEAGYYQYDPTTSKWNQVIAPQIKEAAKPASYQEYEYAKKEGFKGTYNDYQTMDANRKRSISNTTNIIGDSGLTGKQADLFSGVVKQYNSSPLIAASDRTPVLKGAIDEVRKDPTNGVKQLNLVYSYIQALDTYQSAVREGELGLVNSIDSKVGKLSNAVQQIQNGQIVRPEVARDIASAAESIVNTISSAASAKSKSFDSQANTLGVGAAWNKYKQGFTPSFVAPKETTKSTPLWGPGTSKGGGINSIWQ